VTYEVEIEGRTRQVTIVRVDGKFQVTVDGRHFEVDAARVDAQTVSLIVSREGESAATSVPPRATSTGEALEGPHAAGDGRRQRAYDITVAREPASSQLAVRVGEARVVVGLDGRRRRRRDEAAPAAAEPQRLVSPMPGKIVRVLVQTGEAVRARQPLVVVEAMKMENELRAGRDGRIAELHAREGQSVDAGALLVVVQ